MKTAPIKLETLTKRHEFLACGKSSSDAIAHGRPAVLIQARPRELSESALIRMGFTATKRLGNAVIRNRAKRRLREAARALLPDFGSPGYDYVFIARPGVITLPFEVVLDDVKRALIRLSNPRPKAPPQ